MTGSDWEHTNWHETHLEECGQSEYILHRKLDKDEYSVLIKKNDDVALTRESEHNYSFKSKTGRFRISFYFLKPGSESTSIVKKVSIDESMERTKNWWEQYWNNTGVVELCNSKDKRAPELERRIILSQYLLTIQCIGSNPPQETGLTLNSWYGKFHLEMHIWHLAYLPLWNQGELLKKSIVWYKEHLKDAMDNAERNGYKGARWPKMAAYDAVDSPSVIAPLLIWQQPHIIYMLELIYQKEKSETLLKEYWEIIRETATFMCDYVVYDHERECYDLAAPLIPAQEEHDPEITKNPVYELEYFYFALHIAADWARRMGENEGEQFLDIDEKLAPLPIINGIYPAHENCPNTFKLFNKDHPSMVGALGILPGNRVDKEVMRVTLMKILDSWDFSTTWGWDFAMLAMTAVRLGDPEIAIEILMKDTEKNTYVQSGNNFQKLRNDLPLYLPGNGSLLLAVALMTAGYKGCKEELIGFPCNGQWEVLYENIDTLPW